MTVYTWRRSFCPSSLTLIPRHFFLLSLSYLLLKYKRVRGNHHHQFTRKFIHGDPNHHILLFYISSRCIYTFRANPAGFFMLFQIFLRSRARSIIIFFYMFFATIFITFLMHFIFKIQDSKFSKFEKKYRWTIPSPSYPLPPLIPTRVSHSK